MTHLDCRPADRHPVMKKTILPIPMYRWHTLTEDERQKAVSLRLQKRHPLHSPPHIDSGHRHYLITAACRGHQPHIGHSLDRMNVFAEAWLTLLHQHASHIAAWALLPNHYHVLLSTRTIAPLIKDLGKLHGRTSFQWNGEENLRGRQVWHNAVETVMKNTDHHAATLNYIHHNPVKHGYAAKWTDWPWSSAEDYIKEVGRTEAERRWKSYPIQDYGQGWDDASL